MARCAVARSVPHLAEGATFPRPTGCDTERVQQRSYTMVGTIIGAIIIGAIVGALARLVLPGKQNISMLVTIVLGILGSLIGTFIYHSLGGGDTKGVDWIAAIMSRMGGRARVASDGHGRGQEGG